jgi:hypothetical protein
MTTVVASTYGLSMIGDRQRLLVRPTADAERAGCAARTSQNSQKNYNNSFLLFSAFFCAFSVFCVGCWTSRDASGRGPYRWQASGFVRREHRGAPT